MVEEQQTASARVLVVDTDPGVRWALETGLTRSGYEVTVANNVSDALNGVSAGFIDAIVMEILPEAGLTQEVLAMIAKGEHAPKVVCVSADASPRTVIDCMRQGAADFLPKPFGMADVRNALKRALGDQPRPALRPTDGKVKEDEDGPASFLIGISPVMQELRNTIQQVARTDLNCLLRGESGTGKDMVAREIHRLSNRRDKPFVKVNCSALPEQLLESELFGYEKGAFTGAVSSKPGRFELGNKGIVFLDEIGDLHQNLQAKLLQVIEHKEFTKLGGRKHIQVDVQIIAATNADLEERTKEGSFRDDLYFRLNEISIWVPPVTKRREDIPLLVRHFLQKHARSAGGEEFEITGEDLDYFSQQQWPGNVRELESTVKRWLALGKTATVKRRPAVKKAVRSVTYSSGSSEPGETPNAPPNEGPAAPEQAAAAPSSSQMDSNEAPVNGDGASERDEILHTLQRFQWNRRKAAEALGMSYQTLRRRISKYKLTESSE